MNADQMGINQILAQEIASILHSNAGNRLTAELINGIAFSIQQRIEKNLMEVALPQITQGGK